MRKRDKGDVVHGAVAEVVAKQLGRAEIRQVHLERVAFRQTQQRRVPYNALSGSVVQDRNLDVLEEVVAHAMVGVEVLDTEK